MNVSADDLVIRQALDAIAIREDASAVVKDASGRPRLFFHGTQAPDDFSEFSCGGPPIDGEGISQSPDSGPDPTSFIGANFSEERSVAAGFATRSHDWMRGRPHFYEDGRKPFPRVLAVALKAGNPAEFKTEDDLRDYIFTHGSIGDDWLLTDVMERKYTLCADTEEADAWLGRYDSEPELRREVNRHLFLHCRYGDDGEEAMRAEAQNFAESARVALQKAGHDSIRYGNSVEGGVSWIVFGPGQILRAYADLIPGITGASGLRLETDRNPDARTLRALPIPQVEPSLSR